MIAMWGSYAHPDQEIKIKRYYKRAKISPRGLREAVTIGVFLEGWVVADTETAVASRIIEIETAYAFDNNDFVMLNTAGAEGPHVLKSSHPQCLTGVKVMDFQWTDHDPSELLNNRSFTIQLEADYIDPASDLIEYEDSLEYIGNCGPDWITKELPHGPPQDVLLCDQTIQTVIQTGHSIGLSNYYLPLIFNSSRAHGNAQREKPYSGQYNGRGYTHFRMEWTYIHTFTSDVRGFFPLPGGTPIPPGY